MLLTLPHILLVPYGTSRFAPADVSVAEVGTRLSLSSKAPCVVIDRRDGQPLRLNSGQFAPALPPDPTRAGEDQLGFIRDELKRLCGEWDRVSHRFLDWYFAAIAAEVRRHESELSARLAGTEGLFKPGDWVFSAPLPLPRAQLYAPAPGGDADDAGFIEAPFAFWLGDALTAVRAHEHARTPRRAAAEDARLAAAGIGRVTFRAAELADAQSDLLHRILPPPHTAFWLGQTLPMGPFRPAGLAE